jgi:ribulose kinase
VVVVPGTRETESPALGAAMLASVGAGIHPDLATAAAEMVHVERTIEPDRTATSSTASTWTATPSSIHR